MLGTHRSVSKFRVKLNQILRFGNGISSLVVNLLRQTGYDFNEMNANFGIEAGRIIFCERIVKFQGVVRIKRCPANLVVRLWSVPRYDCAEYIDQTDAKLCFALSRLIHYFLE